MCIRDRRPTARLHAWLPIHGIERRLRCSLEADTLPAWHRRRLRCKCRDDPLPNHRLRISFLPPRSFVACEPEETLWRPNGSVFSETQFNDTTSHEPSGFLALSLI